MRYVVLLMAALAGGSPASGDVVARFEVVEPLGQTWRQAWLSREVEVGRDVAADELALVDEAGRSVVAEFVDAGGEVVAPARRLAAGDRVRVDFQTDIARGQTHAFAVVAAGSGEAAAEARTWQALRIEDRPGRISVSNGRYRLEFTGSDLLPGVYVEGAEEAVGTLEWPTEMRPARVESQWLHRGPARAELRRVARFEGEDGDGRAYAVRYHFHADLPWVEVAETMHGLRGRVIWDLRDRSPRRVVHDGVLSWLSNLPMPPRGSTLEPEFHPVATLAPLAPPGWTNTTPYAYVELDGGTGLGLAAIRASQWGHAEGRGTHPWRAGDYRAERRRRPETLTLRVRGDRDQEGQTRVEFPLGYGRRQWAMLPGPHAEADRLPGLIRNRADLPLQRILDDWVLEWESDAPQVSYGLAGQWLDGPYMRRLLGSSSYPRRVRRWLDTRLTDPQARVQSRDLAALAYVFRDANYHPSPFDGSGWYTGNPNGHLDMFNIPMRIGLLMPDHPHAGRWVREGVANLERTLDELMSFEGGAWTESLGYAGFYFDYVAFARELRDRGVVNPFAEWPRLRESARYLAKMHAPVDPRRGVRLLPPLGDTALGHYIDRLRALAEDYRGLDDGFADQLARFPESWEGALDLSSERFAGFGAMLRGNAYSQRESFVTMKAGPARNHFYGDELSVYFAAEGAPLLIDYASHYSPRPWSAAANNRPNPGDLTPISIAAPRLFRAGAVADLFVADEHSGRFHTAPLPPHHVRVPSWDHPEIHRDEDELWRARRYAMLVKHGSESGLPDYLVLRDEIDSPREPAWQNLHVLAREVRRTDPRTFRFRGQLGVDLTLWVFGPEIREVERRQWGWRGDSHQRRAAKFEAYEERYFGDWIPEDFEPGTWEGGEMATWLRLRADPGRSEWTMLLIPHRADEAAATVRRVGPDTYRVERGGSVDVVRIAGDGGVSVSRDGREHVVLERDGMRAAERRTPPPLPWADSMPWQY